jgi:hypothetical protein
MQRSRLAFAVRQEKLKRDGSMTDWLMPSTEPTGADTRSTAMTRDIDAPADELREEASRAKRAASVVADPKAKSRQKKIAKGSNTKAVEIENDLA